MAKPILMDLPPRDPRIELQARLDKAPLDHAEALLSAYEVLQGLHDKGLLEIFRGLLGSSDEVLEIAVEAAKAPDVIRGLRNLILLANTLGAVDPEELAKFTRAVPLALESITRQEKPPSLWKLGWTFLRDQKIRRGLSASVTFLQTLGGSLAEEKKSNPK
jgi:uncharacterized protein YjgD (DUF1641 family)